MLPNILHNPWAKDAVITTDSIQNTAVKTPYLLNNFSAGKFFLFHQSIHLLSPACSRFID